MRSWLKGRWKVSVSWLKNYRAWSQAHRSSEGAHCPEKAGQKNTYWLRQLVWFLWFGIIGHIGQIQLEKEEGPGLSPSHQLWGLLPRWSQYIGTSWRVDTNDAGISFSTSGRASGHTTHRAPAQVKDCSFMGKGDPPILVTGMLPRPLGKTQADGNTWQHMCSLNIPEFKDTLVIARAKKGSECTPEEHMILYMLWSMRKHKLILPNLLHLWYHQVSWKS